jgi:UPF0716 protein FxsA
MPLLLLLVFVVVPIVELYVIIQIGQAIGVLPTLGLLILDSVLGTVLMRAQGRAAWRRFAAAVNAGRPPATEAIDGALVLLGGALLLAPGFITDVLGILLLVPPTRVALRRLAFRRVLERMAVSFRTTGPGPFGPRRGGSDFDVDGTAHDVPPRDRGRLDR